MSALCYYYYSVLAEMIIFLYLGIALYDDHFHSWDTGLVLSTIFFALVFRPIGKPHPLTHPFIYYFTGTFVLTLILNLSRFNKIGLKDTFIMVILMILFIIIIIIIINQSFSGLRGAVAFSLALTRIFEEGAENLPEEEMTLRKRMVTAVTALLLFTVFVQVIIIITYSLTTCTPITGYYH